MRLNRFRQEILSRCGCSTFNIKMGACCAATASDRALEGKGLFEGVFIQLQKNLVFRSLPRTFAIPEKGFVRLLLFSTRITVWQIG